MRFDAKIRGYLESISSFLQRTGKTTSDLHKDLDIDGDGYVDKREFVTRMGEFCKAGQVSGLQPADLGLLFDSLDGNDDGRLSVNELGLYIKSAA